MLNVLVARVLEYRKKVHKIVLNDRTVQLREIADTSKMSQHSVNISPWEYPLEGVSAFAHFRQQQRMMLVAVDETRIYHYAPELNRQSVDWAVIERDQKSTIKILSKTYMKIYEMLRTYWVTCYMAAYKEIFN